MAAKSRVEFIEYYSKREDHRAHWKELGLLLGTEMSMLKGIERDKLKNATTLCMYVFLCVY